MSMLRCADDAKGSMFSSEIVVRAGGSSAAATPSTCAGDTVSMGSGECWRTFDSRRASLLLPRCLWSDDDETTEAGSRGDSESPKETAANGCRQAVTEHVEQLAGHQAFPQTMRDVGGNSEASDGDGDDDFYTGPNWNGKTPVIRYMTRTPNAISPAQSLVWVRPDVVNASHAKGAPPLRLYRLEWDVSNVTAIPTVFAVGDMLISPPFHTISDLATLYIGLVVTPMGPEDLRGITKQTTRRATTRFDFAIRVTSTSDCSARLGVRINDAYSGPFLHGFRGTPWTPPANFGSASSFLAPGENTLRIMVEVYDVSTSFDNSTAVPKTTTSEDMQTSFRRMTVEVNSGSGSDISGVSLTRRRRMTDGCYQRLDNDATAADTASSAVAAALAATTMGRLRNSQSLADLLAAVSAAVEAERRDTPPSAADHQTFSTLLSKAVAQTLLALSSDVDIVTAERFLAILCSIITLHCPRETHLQGGILPAGFFSGLALCVDHLRSKNNWQELMQLRLLLATPGTFFASQLAADQSAWVSRLLCSSNNPCVGIGDAS